MGRRQRVDPHVIVLFGATGDLARRKLWPGLRHLADVGLLPDELRIIASGRGEPDQDLVADWPQELHGKVSFVVASTDDGAALAGAVREARSALGDASRTLFYLSVPPSAMKPMVGMLGATGLADDRARIVMEKPFGRDLQTAKELNAALHEHFAEDQ